MHVYELICKIKAEAFLLYFEVCLALFAVFKHFCISAFGREHLMVCGHRLEVT